MTTESTGTTGGADDLDLFEAEATGQPVAKVTPDTIPEKFKGKTVEDMIQMYQHAERKIGVQGQEIGTLRRLTDEVIGLKKQPTTQTTEQERKPVTVDALLSDPEKTIAQAVANSDIGRRAIRAEERVNQLETSLNEERFTSKHKTVDQDINDPAFVTWVNKNSLRQSLAAEAAKNDSPNRFLAAKNLWDLWDEHKELTTPAGKAKEESLVGKGKVVTSTVRQAPVDGVKGKPIYSRAKVMEFKMRVQQGDPSALIKWNDPTFQQNLNQAYADERVR